MKKDKINNPYEDVINKIESYKRITNKTKAYKKEFYTTPSTKMDNLGLKVELGLKTKEALRENSAKNKMSFEDFSKELDKNKIKPVLEKNERGNLEINYDVYTYDEKKKEVGVTRVEGNQIPYQTKVYAKVDVRDEYEKMISRQRNEELGERVTDGKKGIIETENKRKYLREMIHNNLQREDRIEIKVKNGNIKFKAPNDEFFEKELNKIPKSEALKITERNNNIVEGSKEVSVQDKNKFESYINNAYKLEGTDKNNLKL